MAIGSPVRIERAAAVAPRCVLVVPARGSRAAEAGIMQQPTRGPKRRVGSAGIAVVLAAAIGLSACGGGAEVPAAPPAPVAVSLPALDALRSDLPGRPSAGTSADPLDAPACALLPPVGWQASLCARLPARLAWPMANRVETVAPGAAAWTLVLNNEPAFEAGPCTTGLPGRSRLPGEGPFTVRTTPAALTLRLANGIDDNCRKIPYLGVNTLGTRALEARVGERLHLAFGATLRTSGARSHLHFAHFVVVLDAGLERRMAWLWLHAPAGTAPASFNWNWPVPGSLYGGGAAIRMIDVARYNAAGGAPLAALQSDAPAELVVDLDRLVRAAWPEAAEGARIVGVEIAVEHEFDWASGAAAGTIVTELGVERLRAYRLTP